MNRSSVNWTVQKLYNNYETKKVSFDGEIQRGAVWNVRQRSLFIHSLICDYAVPSLYASKSGKTFSLLDGKQRTLCIISYINGGFALRDVPLVIDENGETDINGMRYDDLPEEFRDRLNGYSLNIVLFDDIERSEVEEIFYRLNNGTSLKANERNFAKSKSKSQIADLCNHELFALTMSKAALAKLTQRNVVIQSLIMLAEKEPCLDARVAGKFMRETEIAPDDVVRLTAIYNSIERVWRTMNEDHKANYFAMKKLTSRGNIPIFVQFMERYGDDEKLPEFLRYFFGGDKGACVNDKFAAASVQGAGHAGNVKIRCDELEKEWKRFKRTNK